jgi:hypothetical protein
LLITILLLIQAGEDLILKADPYGWKVLFMLKSTIHYLPIPDLVSNRILKTNPIPVLSLPITFIMVIQPMLLPDLHPIMVISLAEAMTLSVQLLRQTILSLRIIH